MKLKRKYIWLLLIVAMLTAGSYAYHEYNRKPVDLSGIRSQLNITADSLVVIFETDEPKANSLYLGKPVDIKGLIADISNQQDTLINITLGKKDNMHRVSCLIDANHIKEVKSYKVGDEITLRGICNGYLMDVELNRCVVVK